MKEGALVIRILAILLQFGALNADNSTQYEGCYKNLTSSTGSVSEQEFSGLSCRKHEIRIQAGGPIVFTCQDLVLEVASQQYCVSIDGIKKGKPKSSVSSYAEDGDAPAKRRGKRGLAERSNDPGSEPGKATGRVEKKLEEMEAKLEQAKALGEERMARSLTMNGEKPKGRLGDLKSNYNQNMLKQKPSSSAGNNKNMKRLEKLTLKLQKQEAGILKIEKKMTKLQDNPNKTKQLVKLRKKVNNLRSKSEKLQNQINKLQSLLETTTNGYYDANDPDHANDVSGDDSPDGDSDNDDTNDPDHSNDVNGDDSPDGDSDNDGTNDSDHLNDANGDDSPDGDGDDDDWPKLGNWTTPVNEGIAKPKGERLGKENERNFGRRGKGEGKDNRKKQSFCGPQGQPITVNSKTGEISLSVRPKGPKKGSGGKPSKPAAVVMIPSEVKYTCSWIPASP
ncbi:AAC-rich mRNA clone AAC11 protein-like [Macrobrachium nipponense]|uniref:AAC-rich mRNA clone AAC11 protein-like n=1 Tax=Macrobrachium nipponense TaxID=159736 RepID=UPI0030C81D3B